MQYKLYLSLIRPYNNYNELYVDISDDVARELIKQFTDTKLDNKTGYRGFVLYECNPKIVKSKHYFLKTNSNKTLELELLKYFPSNQKQITNIINKSFNFTLRLSIFSGRPDPQIQISSDIAQQYINYFTDTELNSKLGYRGFVLEGIDDYGLYNHFYLKNNSNEEIETKLFEFFPEYARHMQHKQIV